MSRFVIACDLGTGGNKAALYDAGGQPRAEVMIPYPTHYPRPDYHEQRPDDWYGSVVAAVAALLAEVPEARTEVAAIALSGQSLGCLPLDGQGKALQDLTPIWSDGRAGVEAAEVFAGLPEADWYMRTGNGFPPALYPLFKAMWLRRHEPAVFARTRHLVGSKDYVNFRLTGRLVTDHSYASGSGAYDLLAEGYDAGILAVAGIDADLFPLPVRSDEVIGTLTAKAARELNLPPGVKVVAGGVDNSCMALGAGNTREGSVYNALGSSSWLTVTSTRPVLDAGVRPFVFAHVLPGYFNSAMSTFSSGTSLQWMRELIGAELSFDAFCGLAATSPPGANGLLFVPTLAGGTMLEGGPATRGGLVGMDLSHTRADVARAVLEGIAFSLRMALDRLRAMVPIGPAMTAVGGGVQNPVWTQIYADVYGVSVVRTAIDKGAAALGAAALGLVGAGLWQDYAPLAALHVELARAVPDRTRSREYDRLLPAYAAAAQSMARIGQIIHAMKED